MINNAFLYLLVSRLAVYPVVGTSELSVDMGMLIIRPSPNPPTPHQKKK